ncbi:hypothetical protein D3C87_1672590 [compost metagenome]
MAEAYAVLGTDTSVEKCSSCVRNRVHLCSGGLAERLRLVVLAVENGDDVDVSITNVSAMHHPA